MVISIGDREYTKMKVVVALFALCCLYSTSEADTCNFPAQWEANEGFIYGYLADGKPGGVAGSARVAYDASVGKIAADVSYYHNGKPGQMKLIQDYSKHKMYTIVGAACNTSALPGPFPKGVVGTKSNSTYMGVGDNILNITPYLITSTPGLQGFASVSVTTAECAPVGEVIQGTINGVGITETVGFTGITGGIKDPSVFNPPSSCKSIEKNGLDDDNSLRYKAKTTYHGITHPHLIMNHLLGQH